MISARNFVNDIRNSETKHNEKQSSRQLQHEIDYYSKPVTNNKEITKPANTYTSPNKQKTCEMFQIFSTRFDRFCIFYIIYVNCESE